MKYIAFTSSVALMACRFIQNHCILNGVKIQVEVSTPNAVELISDVTEAEMKILQPIIDKFEGQLTDAIPSPVNFYNPLPRTRRPKKERIEYDFTTRGELRGRHHNFNPNRRAA